MRPTVPRPVNLRADPFEQHMDAPAYTLYAGAKLFNPGMMLGHAIKAGVNGG